MKLMKDIAYRAFYKESVGEIFDRIVSSLHKANEKDFHVLFFLQQPEFPFRKINPVTRILRKFPQMKNFECTMIHSGTGGNSYVLTNLDSRFRNANPNNCTGTVDTKIISNIAHGIPKAYPFFYASFIFEKISCLEIMAAKDSFDNEETKKLSELDPEIPGISLFSHWWITKRHTYASARIAIEPPSQDTSVLPDFAEHTANLLHAIGAIQTIKIDAQPDKKEAEKLTELNTKAKTLQQHYKKDHFKEEILQQFPERYTLPISGKSQFFWKAALIPSPKKLMQSAFKPLGFSYKSNESGQGNYTLEKRTPSNNKMTILFDIGPMSGTLSGVLTIEGLFWRHPFVFFFPANKLAPMSYPIVDAAALENAINISVYLTKRLEATFVKEIEELYGPSPPWFE